MSGSEGILSLAQDLGPQLDVAGRVPTVDVPERRSQQVAPALARAEHLRHAQQVRARRVEHLAPGALAAHVVLGAADHSALDFEHHARARTILQ
jgi:hypothetical protein